MLIGMWVLRAAVFLSITGVIQFLSRRFFSVMAVIQILTFGWMYQVLPRRVAHINNCIVISSVAKLMIRRCR